MPPRRNFGHPGRGRRAGGRQRVPMGVALLLPLLAAAAGLSLQPGRMRHLGVCPNQLNPNLWVDAQSTCERECQADQVSGAAGSGGSGWGWDGGCLQVPQGNALGYRSCAHWHRWFSWFDAMGSARLQLRLLSPCCWLAGGVPRDPLPGHPSGQRHCLLSPCHVLYFELCPGQGHPFCAPPGCSHPVEGIGTGLRIKHCTELPPPFIS